MKLTSQYPPSLFGGVRPDDAELITAIEKRSFEAAKSLIQNRANVNSKDVFGFTALHLAILREGKEYEGLAKLLIE